MELSATYPVATVCEVLGYARSSYYAQLVPSSPKDESALKAEISALCTQWPTYGYRRITKMLHRQGQQVNNKRVRRLIRELGLQRPRQVKKCRTTNSNHSFGSYPNLVKDVEVVRPEQVWVGDITYTAIGLEL